MEKTDTLDRQQFGFYDSTLSDVQEGVLWTDSEGRIAYSNESASRWLGESRSRLQGQSLYDLVVEGELLPWLKTLTQPNCTPLQILMRTGDRVQLYAVVSLNVGSTKYNRFLIKEEGDEGRDPNLMLRIISEGTSTKQ